MNQLGEPVGQNLSLIPAEAFPILEDDFTKHLFDTELTAAETVTDEYDSALEESDQEIQQFHDTVLEVLRGYTVIRTSLSEKAAAFQKTKEAITGLRETYSDQMTDRLKVMGEINEAVNEILLRQGAALYYKRLDAQEQRHIAAKVEQMNSTATTPQELNAKIATSEELGGVEPEKTEDGRYKSSNYAEEVKLRREIDDYQGQVDGLQRLLQRIEYGITESRDYLDTLLTSQQEIREEAQSILKRLKTYNLKFRLVTDAHIEEMKPFLAPEHLGNTAVESFELAQAGDNDVN
jgi:chromosome segregation ATPase